MLIEHGEARHLGIEVEQHMAIKRLEPWSRPREAVGQVLRGATLRTCGPVALVVDTVLSLVNQADVLSYGRVSGLVAFKVGANFVSPTSRRAPARSSRYAAGWTGGSRGPSGTGRYTVGSSTASQPFSGRGSAPITTRSPSGSSTRVTP